MMPKFVMVSLVPLIVAGASAFVGLLAGWLGAYLRVKGENLGTKEDSREALQRVEENTRNVDDIKASVASLWIGTQTRKEGVRDREATMIKKITLIVLASFIAASVQFAQAQQAGKIHRIGVLFFGSRNQPHLESFLLGLRELGYVEGKNTVFEYRYAEGKFDRLRELAAELVSLKVDVIVTTITGSAHAAQQVTKTIPIVQFNRSIALLGITVREVPVAVTCSHLMSPSGNGRKSLAFRRSLQG